LARRTPKLPALIVAAVLMACAVVVLVVSEKAEATFPGKIGRIAYSAFDFDRGPDDTIYTINSGGGARTQLTRGYQPSYSPNGKKIAFSAFDVEAEHEIFVTNVDVTGETQLTENTDLREWPPTWQPNGEKIAFLSAGNSSDDDVYTINADGSGQTRLTKTAQDEGFLTWSLDGKKIALARDTNYEPVDWKIWDSIYIMSADGTGQTRLSAIDAGDFGEPVSIVFVPEGRR
jgi:Tol biopolymer transport system component